jgi:protein O-GlcNAc transferase
MNEGVTLFAQGDPDGAEKAFQRASDLDPRLAHAWLNLGHLHRRSGRFDQAARALRAGLDGSKDPVQVELQAQLGRVLLEQARAPEASHADRTAKATEAALHLRAAVDAEPHRVRALQRLAQAHERLDQPDLADAAYRRAIEADPTHSPAYVGLAELYVAHGHHDLAITILDTNIKINPQRADGWTALGRAQTSAGRHADAIAAFERAIAIDPDALDARFGLGMAHAELGHRKEAITSLERFLQHAGNDVPETIKRAANDTVARLQDVL